VKLDAIESGRFRVLGGLAVIVEQARDLVRLQSAWLRNVRESGFDKGLGVSGDR